MGREVTVEKKRGAHRGDGKSVGISMIDHVIGMAQRTLLGDLFKASRGRVTW